MAGVTSIVLIVAAVILIAIANFDFSWMPKQQNEITNDLLLGLATNLMGIIVTVSFVQHLVDRQNEANERREEDAMILRYHKYMQALIRRYLKYYYNITTLQKDRRDTCEIDQVLQREFLLSDMADMYKGSLYLNEGFNESSIELFYKAEHEMKDYMLKILSNIEFKFNPKLETLLLDFAVKSTDLDMSGQIIERAVLKNTQVGSRNIKMIENMLSNESLDWLVKFKRGELEGNLMLPYVILYYNIQDQIRIIKEYTEYVNEIANRNK